MSSNVRSATIGWSTTALGPHDAPITGHILLWKLLSDDRDAEGAEERKSDGPAAVPDHLEVEDYDRSLEVKTGALQHAVTGLQHSSTYIFAVQTFNMVGQSPVSPPSAPVQTQYKPHAAPSAPRLSGRFARRLELEWDEPVCTDDRVVRCVCACACAHVSVSVSVCVYRLPCSPCCSSHRLVFLPSRARRPSLGTKSCGAVLEAVPPSVPCKRLLRPPQQSCRGWRPTKATSFPCVRS